MHSELFSPRFWDSCSRLSSGRGKRARQRPSGVVIRAGSEDVMMLLVGRVDAGRSDQQRSFFRSSVAPPPPPPNHHPPPPLPHHLHQSILIHQGTRRIFIFSSSSSSSHFLFPQLLGSRSCWTSESRQMC